ncbi:MAG: amidase [Gemmatimonadota bacterium]|nr:amidase [Gemmatimonadota bacterium]
MTPGGGPCPPERPGGELPDLSALEIRRRIDAGEVSPIDVVEACLERLEAVNPALNAVVTVDERALEDARELEAALARGEAPGPLCGIPVGIKDVTEVAGLRTTWGSPLYADHVPEVDALVVRRLREAGAVILGKTNTPEFAAGGNTWNDVFGRTRNPWDPSRSAGGSTGGGAAGLATGMIALAEGTDLGGSLRIPASFCGVVGLRPSVGLVPTRPTNWLWDTHQVTGTMARTAADVALSLQAVAGPDRWHPLAEPVAGRDLPAAVAAGPAPGLRIAWCPDLVGIGIDPGVEGVCLEAVEALEAEGHLVEKVDLDLSFGRDAFLALRGLWFVVHMWPRLERLDELGVNVRSNTRAGLEVTTREIAAAEHARARIREIFRELFERHDHLLTPTMAVPPFPVEENYPESVAGEEMETYIDWVAPTFVPNLAALPIASVPAGLDAGGLPVGLQVIGPPRAEEAVLALAGRIQELRPIGSPDLPAP